MAHECKDPSLHAQALQRNLDPAPHTSDPSVGEMGGRGRWTPGIQGLSHSRRFGDVKGQSETKSQTKERTRPTVFIHMHTCAHVYPHTYVHPTHEHTHIKVIIIRNIADGYALMSTSTLKHTRCIACPRPDTTQS